VPPGYPISFIIETGRTIERRLIHTLHSVGRIIPRFGVAIRAAADDQNVARPGLHVGARKEIRPDVADAGLLAQAGARGADHRDQILGAGEMLIGAFCAAYDA